jgi:hypothetical protein
MGASLSSKQRFFVKKRAKNFIRLARTAGKAGLQGTKSFFASFCSQKENLPC